MGNMMTANERRSGIDIRTDAEKQLAGERRSGVDRRTSEQSAPTIPANEQLALFARRLRRIMRDEKARSYFGIASAEQEFTFFPDVIRIAEWIERLSTADVQHQTRPSLRKAIAASTTDSASGETGERPAVLPHPDPK